MNQYNPQSKLEIAHQYEDIKPGKYRHYKGNFYEVLSLASHSETLELMVVYRALHGVNGLWVRPAAMWNELVGNANGEVKRFEYVGDDNESD